MIAMGIVKEAEQEHEERIRTTCKNVLRGLLFNIENKKREIMLLNKEIEELEERYELYKMKIENSPENFALEYGHPELINKRP